MAFAQAHIGADDPAVRARRRWLKRKQNADGGWGESNDTYAQGPGVSGHFAEHRLPDAPGRCWACSPRARLDRTPRAAASSS